MIIFIPATITPVELRCVAIRSSVMHAWTCYKHISNNYCSWYVEL